MTNQYWLVKQEPEAYAWETFVSDKKTSWEGVRNYQARNNLKAMKVGDLCLFYASVTTKAVLGTAEVTKTAYPDPSAEDGDWVAVELRALKPLKKPVTLDAIKADRALKNMVLVKNSRLSVQPVTAAEFERIMEISSE